MDNFLIGTFPVRTLRYLPSAYLIYKGTEGVFEAGGKGDKLAATIGFRLWSMLLLITTKPHEKTISVSSDARFTIIRHRIRGCFANERMGYK